MAWTYSDWDQQTTPAARLSRLSLHIKEVTDKIAANVSADGKSRDSSSLNQLLTTLNKRYDQLLSAAGTAGGISIVKFRRVRR